MTNLSPDNGNDTGVTSDPTSTTSTPGWVKVFGIIGVVLVLLFVVLQFVSGGKHGPGRHMPPMGIDDIPPTRVTDVYISPEDGRL